MKTKRTQWSVSPLVDATYLGAIEFQDSKGEFHNFDVMHARGRLVFGGACNAGFIESGYLVREDGEGTADALTELLADLETYYNDGAGYVSRIVCNERM